MDIFIPMTKKCSRIAGHDDGLPAAFFIGFFYSGAEVNRMPSSYPISLRYASASSSGAMSILVLIHHLTASAKEPTRWCMANSSGTSCLIQSGYCLNMVYRYSLKYRMNNSPLSPDRIPRTLPWLSFRWYSRWVIFSRRPWSDAEKSWEIFFRDLFRFRFRQLFW